MKHPARYFAYRLIGEIFMMRLNDRVIEVDYPEQVPWIGEAREFETKEERDQFVQEEIADCARYKEETNPE